MQTRYLLGKLSDAESASLEERSFVDDEVFNEIEIAEDELIDAYVFGRLSAEDRERFENKLLKSERIAERVQFARLLSESKASQVMDHEPAKRSWLPGFFDISSGPNPALTSAAAAALFLVLLGLPVFVWMRMRFESRLNLERTAIEQAANEQRRAELEQQKLQADEELARRDEKTNELDAALKNSKAEEARLQQQLQNTKELLARANVPPNPVASTYLYPGTSRAAGQSGILRVLPTNTVIELKVVLDPQEHYDKYLATIVSADDNVLHRDLRTTRSRRSQIITFTVPAKDLPAGDYTVRITGRTSSETYELVRNYSVQVVKD